MGQLPSAPSPSPPPLPQSDGLPRPPPPLALTPALPAPQVSLAVEAARRVMGCEALRDVLALGLAVGNFVNEGHMLGNAQARARTHTRTSAALLDG